LHLKRRDLLGPPGHLVAAVVQLPMMISAEWHGELVTDLAPERARLGEL
jgi:hypothetical protein